MINIWRPDSIILEDIQMQEKKQNRNWENDDGDSVMNTNTFKTLAQLQGVLENLLYENDIEYSFVHTAVWRKACGINGKYRDEKKKSAQLKVKEWFNITVTNDEADAICIGYYATHKRKKNETMLEW